MIDNLSARLVTGMTQARTSMTRFACLLCKVQARHSTSPPPEAAAKNPYARYAQHNPTYAASLQQQALQQEQERQGSEGPHGEADVQRPNHAVQYAAFAPPHYLQPPSAGNGRAPRLWAKTGQISAAYCFSGTSTDCT